MIDGRIIFGSDSAVIDSRYRTREAAQAVIAGGFIVLA